MTLLLNEEKRLVLYSILLVTASAIVGAVLQKFLLSEIFETGIVESDELDHWWYFFKNNSISVLIIIFGIFIYAITTIFSLIFNGLVLGIALVSAADHSGSSMDIIMSIVPHGILEMPALILAGMVGLKGFSFYKQERDKKYYIRLGKLISIVLVLLLFASFIEAYITVPFEPKGG